MKLKRASCVVILILLLSFSVIASFPIKASSLTKLVSNNQTNGYEITAEENQSSYVPEWNYTANLGSYDDRAVGVVADSKNNIIVVGYNRIYPVVPADYCWNITKFDEGGNVTWSYVYDNPGKDDKAVGVAVDSQDNFVVVGYDKNTSSSSDFEWRIIKFNSTNDKQWEIPYNITPDDDRPTCVAIDHDKNIIVVGYYNASSITERDVGWWIVKFNRDGEQLWSTSFNFTDYADKPNGVAIDNDNNITVVGYDNMTSSGFIGWGIVKLDKNSNVLWQYHDDVSPYSDEAKGVAIDHDNNIIVVGYDRLPGSNNSEWRIMKFYPDRNQTLWNYTDNISTANDWALGVTIDNYDNNITVVGYDFLPGGSNNNEWRIIRLGYDGISLWNYSIDSSQYNDQAVSVIADHNDDLIVAGFDGTFGNNDLQWMVMKFRSLSSRVHNINTGLNYATIQEAINADETLNGHTIQVDKGTYYENIVMNKPISLIGENRETTIIDGGGVGNVTEVTSDNITISGFTIKNSGGGHAIVLNHAKNCNISQNDIASNSFGIMLYGSSENRISANHIANNEKGAIHLYNSSNNEVSNNYIANNLNGITLILSSDHNIISWNNITNNDAFGLHIAYSSGNILRGNTIDGSRYNFGIDGYSLSYLIHDIDASNTVNGKPILYFVNQQGLVISPKTYPSVGYLAVVNSTNITAQHLSIERNDEGVLFAYSKDSLIQNVTLMSNREGIFLGGSSNNTVTKSQMTNNSFSGIHLENSSTNLIFGNNITGGGWGLYLLRASSGNVISQNEIHVGEEGIKLIEVSNNNSITQNTIAGAYRGISLTNSSGNILSDNIIVTIDDAAVGLTHSSNNNIIIENRVSNSTYGILIDPFLHRTVYGDQSIYRCSGNRIVGNYLAYNIQGLHLNYSLTSFIFHNSFVENEQQILIGESFDNVWDDGYPSGGNYWSDYIGNDTLFGVYQNETGYDWIGDSPYVIDQNNTDRYPLMHPFVLETEEIRVAYRNLLLKYNDLVNDFKSLNSTYYQLLNDHSELVSEFENLNSTYYQHLLDYSELLANYTSLKNSHDDLNSMFVQLTANYTTLQNSYNQLQSRQEAITTDLNSVRNLAYISIGTTIVFIATTIFLALKKTKPQKKVTDSR